MITDLKKMDPVSRRIQVAGSIQTGSMTKIPGARSLSQISFSSSGLSLNFAGTSKENLHNSCDHGLPQPWKSQSFLELTQAEPLTMYPLENPDTLPNHIEGDVYNVLNPIPMLTDLLGSDPDTTTLPQMRADSDGMPDNPTEFSEFIGAMASTSGMASVNMPNSSINNAKMSHSVPYIPASNEIGKLYSCEDAPRNTGGSLLSLIQPSRDEQDEQKRSTARVPLEPIVIIHDENTDDVNTASESHTLVEEAHRLTGKRKCSWQVALPICAIHAENNLTFYRQQMSS